MEGGLRQGVIDAVGDGVDPTRIGERVWLMLAAKGSRYGTAAEYCIVDSDYVRALPTAATFEPRTATLRPFRDS